ncbi:MAG TPA: transposase, partial [Phycisphaerae bacterium]|nr:transposase [Phycisphaerae bacterium]HQL76253.1 transposase [Phycisphaerae bacterium]
GRFMAMQDGETVRKRCQRWNTAWQAHGLTFSCYRRQAFLAKDRTRGYLADAVNRARETHGFHVWAYVFMPEHVHLLLWPAKEKYSMSLILQSVKQSASRRAVAWLRANDPAGLRLLATGQRDRPWQFWQDGGGHDRNIRNAKALRDFFTYIHYNPVKRGLVAQPEDWQWSSARDWNGLAAGPIPIDKQSFIDSAM